MKKKIHFLIQNDFISFRNPQHLIFDYIFLTLHFSFFRSDILHQHCTYQKFFYDVFSKK